MSALTSVFRCALCILVGKFILLETILRNLEKRLQRTLNRILNVNATLYHLFKVYFR